MDGGCVFGTLLYIAPTYYNKVNNFYQLYDADTPNCNIHSHSLLVVWNDRKSEYWIYFSGSWIFQTLRFHIMHWVPIIATKHRKTKSAICTAIEV